MSAPDSFNRDSQQSAAGLSLNLSSNNPFRNRAASPASPFDDVPPPRPVSRNPFIDQPPPVRSQDVMSNHSDHKSMSAEEIFASLTLDDGRPRDRNLPPALGPRRPGGENVPPGANNFSQTDDLKNRRMPPPAARPGPSASPSRRPPPQQRPRPRRNSDSSALDFDAAPLTEEEKRMIAKRRERERRLREARAADEAREGRENKKEEGERSERRDRERREGRDGRDGRSKSSKPVKPSRRMDIIDQLDATSIYGTGLFHHDGPFDALNPHRNRNTARRAPMQAFPEGSLNNSLGGSGPLRKEADHSTFLGQGTDEAFRDFSYSNQATVPKTTAPIFDPVARGDVIHGDESEGLGTSTFLEGTPAARTAIARHHKEQSQEIAETDLRRKKSLAQRIRHINKGPRDYNAGGRVYTPDALGQQRSPESAGGAIESNPFFSEYSKGEESISVRPREDSWGNTSPPLESRRGYGAPLERRSTTDATGSEEPAAKPSGILGRMKSLKGGRKPRNPDPSSPPAHPGTAI